MKRLATTVLVSACMMHASPARADEQPGRATFALIVGSNQSVDAELAPLKYADDDAARYLDLFRLLGARTYLLTRLDDNTRRLHPQAAAEAEEPKRAPFDRAVAQLTRDVTQARDRGVETLVYFVYAGHGNVKNGEGYLTLEDSRVTGGELAQIVARVPATRIHVVADACASYFLAQGRGPGGERRALEGLRSAALKDDARVGLLLSTSSARESHEWDAYQGGVFSHEVRSGLYGGADADGDGVVSYREIAAFVQRANAAVPNEKYRPDVYARAPKATDALLDIRSARGRRLVIDGAHAGHYFLEDANGVRLADVHNAPGQSLSLVRPGPNGPIYLRRVDDDKEFVLDAGPEILALADLSAGEPRSQTRGAAHEAFNHLFAMPFDAQAVAEYREPPPPDSVQNAPIGPRRNVKTTIGFVALGAGAVALGAGTYFAARASSIGSRDATGLSNADAAAQNDRVNRFDTGAIISFTAAGVLAATGVTLLLWPTSGVRATALPGGGFAGYGASF
jgi:hypothetical protein